ncbi:hypothetical protein PV326_005525 [Microctonus aethiopoides]|nr:hypothetical protein PV326_005525 [Microctonus aethiopoides]
MCSVNNNGNKREACWNDMEQMKYLIGSLDCIKCPRLPPTSFACTRTLPPRLSELPSPPKRIEFPYPPPLPPRKVTLISIPRSCCLRILPALNILKPHCQLSYQPN